MLSNFGRTLQCILFGFIALVVTSLSLDAFSKPPAVQTPVFKDYFESLEPGQEFKIKIPPKWIAEVGTQRFAVTLKPSSKAERIKLPGGVIADPNITVAVVKKPVSFSQESVEAVAKEIEESFIRFNGAGTGFQIFQKNLLTDLPGGQSGLLYYVSFKSDGTEAGQAILVMGDEKIRYRITLSDHRLNFDRNLELYYPYMTSLEFKSIPAGQSAPLGIGPAQAYLPWLIAAIAVLVSIVMISKMRRSAASASSGMGGYPASGVSQAPASMNSAPTSLSSIAPSGPSNSIESAQSRSVGAPEYSMIPQSMIGVSGKGAGQESTSEAIDPAFSDKDLSAPPQSVPLSQVVDESSAPPDLKKRWQIFTKNRN
jgi:hypothetical protein